MPWKENDDKITIVGTVSDPKPAGDPVPENPPREEPAEQEPEPQEAKV